jgi:hypothetical protein
MVGKDLIIDVSHMPTYDEIDEYMNLPARELLLKHGTQRDMAAMAGPVT